MKTFQLTCNTSSGFQGFFIMLKMKGDFSMLSSWGGISEDSMIDIIGIHVQSDTSSLYAMWKSWRSALAESSIPLFKLKERPFDKIDDIFISSIQSFMRHLGDVDFIENQKQLYPFASLAVDQEEERTFGNIAALRAVIGREAPPAIEGVEVRELTRCILVLGLVGSGLMTMADQIQTRVTSLLNSSGLPVSLHRLHFEHASLKAIEARLSAAFKELELEGERLIVVSYELSPEACAPVAHFLTALAPFISGVLTLSVTSTAGVMKVRRPMHSSDLQMLEDADVGSELFRTIAIDILLQSDSAVIFEDDCESENYTCIKRILGSVRPQTERLRLQSTATWLDNEFVEKLLFSALKSSDIRMPHNSARGQILSPRVPGVNHKSVRSFRGFDVKVRSRADVIMLSQLLRRLFPGAVLSMSSEISDRQWKLPPNSDKKGLRRAIQLARSKVFAALDRENCEKAFHRAIEEHLPLIKSFAKNLYAAGGEVSLSCDGWMSEGNCGQGSNRETLVAVEANAGTIFLRCMEFPVSQITPTVHFVGLFTANEEEQLRKLLQDFGATKLPKKAKLQKENLSASELAKIQAAHVEDSLPPDWAYDGSAYVSYTGEKRLFRPDIFEFTEDYLEKMNRGIDAFNRMRDEYYSDH